MADLVLHITAKDDASAALKGVKGEVAGLGTSIKGMAGVIGSAGIAQGIGAITGELATLTKGAAEDAASQARLQKAIENTGASYSDYSRQLQAAISSGQKLGFTDDQTRDSLSLLAAQTGDTEEAMKRYALAQDLARGANIDVVTASKLLGKVTDENVNVLGRYGISVEKGATETELFAAIQQKFGGQAKEFGDSVAGAAERNKIAMDEMRESMGAKLLPVMSAVTTGFQAMPGPMQTVVAAFGAFGPQVGQTLFGFMALAPLLGKIGPLMSGIGPAIGVATTAMKGMSLAMLTPPLGIVVALAAIGVAAYIFRDDIIGAFKSAAAFVMPIVSTIGGAIMDGFNAVLGFFSGAWREIATLISGPFLPIVALATNAFGIRDALFGAFNSVLDFLRGAWSTVSGLVSGPLEAIVGFAGDAFGVVSTLVGAFTGLVSTVAGIVSEGFTFVKDTITGILTDLGGAVHGLLLDLAGIFGTVFGSIKSRVTSIIEDMAGTIRSVVGGIVDFVRARVEDIKRFVADAKAAIASIPGIPSLPSLPSISPGTIIEIVPGFQHGTPYVPQTGLALLHKGEAVIPASQNRQGEPARGSGFVFNNYGPLTVNNIGEERDATKTAADLAFSLAAEMRARGILAA